MPQQIPDSWAWWRTVLGPDGPPSPITRFVLSGYMRFMNRDGQRCWPGVRRVSLVTRLNKDTVSRHLARALAAGWLVRPGPAFQGLFRLCQVGWGVGVGWQRLLGRGPPGHPRMCFASPGCATRRPSAIHPGSS